MTPEEYEERYWADYEARFLIDWQRYEEEFEEEIQQQAKIVPITKVYPDAD